VIKICSGVSSAEVEYGEEPRLADPMPDAGAVAEEVKVSVSVVFLVVCG